MRAALAAALFFLFAAGAAVPAAADRSFQVTLLTPTSDGQGLVGVERSQTPRRWEVFASLLLDYIHAPLQLTLPSADGSGTGPHNLITDQLALDVGLSMGLWDFLLLGATIPVAVQWYDDAVVGQLAAAPPGSQGATTPVPTVATGIYQNLPRTNVGLSGAGPQDPRLFLKGRLFHNERFGLGLMLSLTLPVGNSDSFLGEKGVTVRPVLIGDVSLGPVALLANLGFLFRPESYFSDPEGTPAIFSVGHEFTFGLGLSYRLHRLLGASLEAFGSVPLVGSPTFVEADLLGAVHLYPAPGFRLLLGLGGGLNQGAPLRDEARLVAGLSFSPSPARGAP